MYYINYLYVYVYLYYSLWIIICHYIFRYILMKSIDFTELISHSHFSIRNFYVFRSLFNYLIPILVKLERLCALQNAYV